MRGRSQKKKPGTENVLVGTWLMTGGEVTDITQPIPSLLDWHLTVNIVIAHVGTNDIMARNSIRRRAELESLCFTIESLGRHCIVSGPIPFNSRESERFSRLYSLYNWLKNFHSAAGYDLI